MINCYYGNVKKNSLFSNNNTRADFLQNTTNYRLIVFVLIECFRQLFQSSQFNLSPNLNAFFVCLFFVIKVNPWVFKVTQTSKAINEYDGLGTLSFNTIKVVAGPIENRSTNLLIQMPVLNRQTKPVSPALGFFQKSKRKNGNNCHEEHSTKINNNYKYLNVQN